MYKRILLFFIFLLPSAKQTLWSQNQVIDSSYTRYFEDTREIPFLHLNKTSFLKGEEVWFQAYVLEQNSKQLHPTTSNLYVGIFNDDGSLKEQQLVHVKKGIGIGSIYIDSTFTKDHYYIKATTNWMRNFKEDNSYLQKIKIIKNTIPKNKLANASAFDFQVFPEGGHLLEGIQNTIGVLIKNQNGKGVALDEIILKDIEGNIVKHFATNFLGLAKVSFVYQQEKQYTMEALLSNGEKIEVPLPKAKKEGLTLNVKNPNASFISATLTTNERSLARLAGKTYTILIHNTSSFYKNTITFNDKNTSYALLINDDNIFKGTNIITVFDEQNTPILERVFFNYSEDLFADVKINIKKSESDSIRAQLKNESNETLQLSASFLPGQTKAYKPTNNIFTSFLLKPYIKGTVENAAYYFTNTNRKKLYNLDLLLLTQGWSKYSWQDIFNDNNDRAYAFENGITITGSIKEALGKRKRPYLVSEENRTLEPLLIDGTSFELKNRFFKKDSELKFGIANSSYVYKMRPEIKFPKLYTFERLESRLLHHKTLSNELEISNFEFLQNEGELLDGITITAKKDDSTTEVNPYGKETMLTGYKMSDRINLAGESIATWLQEKRFKVELKAGTILSIGPRRGQYGGLGRDESSSDLNFNSGVRIYLDGIEVSQTLWMLDNLYLDLVKEIYIGDIPEGLISRAQIYIYTYNPTELAKKNNRYSIVKAKEGFAKEKTYYEPLYPSYTENTYKNYGALYWKPQITIEKKNSYNISIPKHYQKTVNIYIEGISKTGKLIHKTVKSNHPKQEF